MHQNSKVCLMIPPQKIQLYVWLEFWFTVLHCWNSWWETFCTPVSNCIQSVPFFFSPLILKHPDSTAGWVLPLKYYFAIIFASCPLIQIIMFEQWLVAQYEFTKSGRPARFKELILIRTLCKVIVLYTCTTALEVKYHLIISLNL